MLTQFNKPFPHLLLWAALPALVIPVAAQQKEDRKEASTKAVDVTVVTEAPEPLDDVGRTVISREEIRRQVPGGGDLNRLGVTVPGVEFDNGAGLVSENSILNLRPALLSIGGGQAYANSFLVDGLSVSSMRDSSNENMHHYIEVVGHPQSTFINPTVVDSVTFYTNDVPVSYGNFTGGVVEANLRDPLGASRVELAGAYTADNWVHYLSAEEDRSTIMPQKKQFYRWSSDATVDFTLGGRTSAYFSWSREESFLEHSQHHASYGVYDHSAKTRRENYVFKVAHSLDRESKLRFSTVYAPYEQENHEQSLKLQYNTGWTNKIEYARTSERYELKAHVAALWSDTSREQEANLYTYRNFGATDSITWVADTNTSAIRGGFGDINSTQFDLPVSADFTWKATDTGTLKMGVDSTWSDARYERPETASAYRHQTSPAAMNRLVVSGDSPDDPTVIAGEQALNYRIVYNAFDARVKLNSRDAWVQWSDHGRVLNRAWDYRVGLRYDSNDFLSNNDVAPRALAGFKPASWLHLSAGWSRYYSNAFLSYALQEQYPDNYIYNRTGRSENGKLVYYASDWKLYTHSRSASAAESGAKTPYSDEASVGATANLKQFGQLSLRFVDRKARDEFSRDGGTRETYTNEKTGATGTYTVYRITNDGYTNSNRFTLAWSKAWSRHLVKVSTSYTDVESTTTDPLTESDPSEFEELVSYQGRLVTRREIALARSNFARPRSVSFQWTSEWFKRRVAIDLLGRWSSRYTYVEDSYNSVRVGNAVYSVYEDVNVPANLINDLNLQWKAWSGRRLGLTLQLKVGNVFDRLPHSTSATTTNPYQEGRSFWLRSIVTY